MPRIIFASSVSSMAATALLVALAVALPACDNADLEAYCEEVASCQGLNDKDQEACVVLEEAGESLDSEIGCSDEHVTYYDCLLDKGKCTAQGVAGIPCQTSADCPGGQCTTDMQCEFKRFGLEGDDCKAERAAYKSCSFN